MLQICPLKKAEPSVILVDPRMILAEKRVILAYPRVTYPSIRMYYSTDEYMANYDVPG